MEQVGDAPMTLGDNRQVSGSDLTLSEAIRHNIIERPALVGWNEWQPWRRDFGRMPTQAADGYMLPSQMESALWRATMLEMYGQDWAMTLTLREANEGRHVSRCRLQAAERRQAELLRAEVLPPLQDEPAPVP